MKKTFIFMAGILLIVALMATSARDQRAQAPAAQNLPGQSLSSLRVNSDFGKMPLYFIANEGQMDERVAFYVQGKDKTLYFTPEGVTFALASTRQEKAGKLLRELGKQDKENISPGKRRSMERGLIKDEMIDRVPPEGWVAKLDFVGANPEVKPTGIEKNGALVSYFKGKPADWHTGLATYSKIIYKNLWPGIDLVYYGTFNMLKYEFIVHPGADPSNIRLAYRGAEIVSVDEEGRLQVMTPVGGFRDDKPVAYQEAEGKRVNVSLAYKFGKSGYDESSESELPDVITSSEPCRNPPSETHEYGFEIGDYDRTQPLVIDPAVLIYCGYIGGSSDEYAYGIAVDGAGNSYVTGMTYSAEATFPVKVGPDLIFNGGDMDAFVAKINASGTSLIYCGYIGGSGPDEGYQIAVDGAGNAYVTGETMSDESTFPVSVGPDLTFNGGDIDAFVAKINATGTALFYCGYIGGSEDDYGDGGIAVDGSGNAYMAGTTYSTEATFPVTVGPDLSFNGVWDAFVAKINATGTAFVYCGYIGGSEVDWSYGIAVDGSGNAYVTGNTDSTEGTFPVSAGPDMTYNGGYTDAFVVKINASGTALTYCGYIGGSGDDSGYGIAVDGVGNAYVTGNTDSTEATFPVKAGPDLTHNGFYDIFVAKVNPSGTALTYCGYIGGSNFEDGDGIAVDGSGCAYVTGIVYSAEDTFPVAIGPDLIYNGGYGDGYVAKVNASGTALIYCGYIGGSGGDSNDGIAVDGSGNAYVAGGTDSTEATFPVTIGPDMTYNGGYTDAFVAKISAYEPQFPIFDGNDYDGNGTSEISVFRPSNGVWYISGLSDTQWGMPGDIPVPGNYDLDPATEIAVFRPTGGLWYIYGISTTQWGTSGDIPVPHDYNGGGATDLAVWRPSNGVWYINGVGDFQWGQDGDYLVPGDYNGDGIDDVAVWRPANGEWFIYGGGYSQWGAQGDIPVPADYDGDGATDVAVYRPSIGMWYIQYSGGGTAAVQWGTMGDIPVPGDYDGNGTTDIAIWRPSDGLWYIFGGTTTQYGIIGDVPLVR